MSQLSLQFCCFRRQGRYLGSQLFHFLVVLGLSHQDLLCSLLHINILAHPAQTFSPCMMEGDVFLLPGIVTNVATEGWGCSPSMNRSNSIAGLMLSAFAVLSLVVSNSRCCAYPTTLSATGHGTR